jgi:hypothetical protein
VFSLELNDEIKITEVYWVCPSLGHSKCMKCLHSKCMKCLVVKQKGRVLRMNGAETKNGSACIYFIQKYFMVPYCSFSK